MSGVFRLNTMNIYIFNYKIILYASTFMIMNFVIPSENALSNTNELKESINGSGLKIPRMVSLKNSLTYMRTGPGKEFPVKFELKQKGYPLQVVAEFNNWRKVVTYSKTSGWVHTQLLSSVRTGLITKTTFLKKMPSGSSNSLAKLLPNLLIIIKNCQEKWCKVEINKKKKFLGWVQKETVWGSTKN
jgi:SH3-like domain-containing protein